MTDRLVEIDRIDLSNLKNLYTPDGAKSYVAYTTIDNYIRWFEQDPNVKHIKFYCLNGDITDGTFVVTVSIYQMFISKSKFVISLRIAVQHMLTHSISHMKIFLDYCN